MDQKQRVNKKQKLPSTCKIETNFEIGNTASSVGLGQYTHVLASFGIRFIQHCQCLTSVFLLKKHYFEKELIKTNETAINAESGPF